MQKDPDYALIRKCQSNDDGAAESAFEELFEAYRDRVYNLAFRLLNSHSDAEDVTQEAFVTVYRKIDDFRYSSRFYTWLYRIVYNLCVDHKRRASTQAPGSTQPEHADERLEAVQDPGSGPADTVAEAEFRRRNVDRALARLSSPLRAVILLRYLEDLQYGEIAEVLGCSVGTVKSRLSRAHHFLHEVLGPLAEQMERK